MCTDFGGLPEDVSSQAFPRATELQLAIIDLLRTSSDMVDMRTFGAGTLNVSSLLALTNEIVALPDDQWVLEMKKFQANVFAGLQLAVADYAIGAKARDPLAGPYTRAPETAGEKELCGIQRMKKSGGFA